MLTYDKNPVKGLIYSITEITLMRLNDNNDLHNPNFKLSSLAFFNSIS